MSEYVIVQTTVDDHDKAADLALGIVDAGLAACVHRSKVKSTYRWNDEVEQADEYLLAAKTEAGLADKLSVFIKANHPYEVPEIIVVPVAGGDADYLKWISDETKS